MVYPALGSWADTLVSLIENARRNLGAALKKIRKDGEGAAIGVAPRISALTLRWQDLNWVRYLKFAILDRKKTASLEAYKASMPAKFSALQQWHFQENRKIEADENHHLVELVSRRRLVADHKSKPTTERIDLPWSNYDDVDEQQIGRWSSDRSYALSSAYDGRYSAIERDLRELQDDADKFRSDFLISEADRYGIPLPSQGETASWLPGRADCLSVRGRHDLRVLVRKERRDRWEYIQIRIAFFLSIVTFAITLSGLLHSPATGQAASNPRPAIAK